MEPLGITLFCDDIRFERSNKVILVGIYGPEMLVVGEMPFVLPRFGMYVQLRLPAGSSSPSKVLVYFPDSKDVPAVTVDIAQPNTDNLEKSKHIAGGDTISLLATNVPILLGPIRINEEGLIRVRIQWEDKIIRAGTLKVRRVTEADAILSTS